MKTLFSFSIVFFFGISKAFSQTPTLDWVKSFGSNTYDGSYAVDIDNNEDVIITGFYSGTTDFNPAPTVTNNLTAVGNSEGFIAKYNKQGNYIWAVSLEGSTGSYTYGRSVKVDQSGNIFISGSFTGVVDFNPGGGTNYLNSNQGSFFILKLDLNGGFIWASQLDGTYIDDSQQLALDENNNLYIIGLYNSSTDFELFSSSPVTFSGTGAFVAKYSNSGILSWVKSIVGIPNAIDIDLNGNVFLAGQFTGTQDFNPGSGTYNMTGIGGYDTYTLKLDSNGDFIWANAFLNTTTAGNISTHGIKVTNDGNNLYLVGDFITATIDFGVLNGNNVYLTSGSTEDVFVAKISTSNGGLVWIKQISSPDVEFGYSIKTDQAGNLYVNGVFYSTNLDFDPSITATYPLDASSGMTYVLKLNANGEFVWAVNFGGDGTIWPTNSIAYDDIDGSIYTAGLFHNTVDFDPSASTCNLTSSGFEDIYIHKLIQPGIELDLTCLIEGYYLTSNTMRPARYNEGCIPSSSTSIADFIDVELRSQTAPYGPIAYGIINTELDINGNAHCAFHPGLIPDSYYIVIKHRNAIQTWSSNPVTLIYNTSNTYDFTNNMNKAYGNNMVEVSSGVWAFYSGDINQDENIDFLDDSILSNDISSFLSGCYSTDINGDGNIDLLDAQFVDANILNFIYSNHP